MASIEKLTEEWRLEQTRLKKKLSIEDTNFWSNVPVSKEYEKKISENKMKAAKLELVAGVDISFFKGTNRAVASLVVMNFPSLKVVYEAYSAVEMKYPYIAGYLAFREVPGLVALFKELKAKKPELWPQVTLVDGNGILHHCGFGLASHLGVLLGIRTVGVAKNLLCIDGLSREWLNKEWKQALDNGSRELEIVGKSGNSWGVALAPVPKGSKPIFVSPGHQISIEMSKAIVKACAHHRIPEPVRQADLRSRKLISKMKKDS
eukprot:CAMPEP_0167748316 /NCGR_PEP_ID=MMETSP0110_2-20121227/4772_1 /TAXON_ID=629695 /ORGANISM="Gymnochlora sp., Strain CCMP2014" /LENGTH=261 /DNA_ID=CAMNT_0007633321 /DNA_START=47 /DNA_END=829 /DNA_ORIENTATION=-